MNGLRRDDLVRAVIDGDRIRWAIRTPSGWCWRSKSHVRNALRLEYATIDIVLVMAAALRNPHFDTDIENWAVSDC